MIYYDIAIKFPVVGVAPIFVLKELAMLNDLIDILPNTLEIGDTEGSVEGHYYGDDWDVIVATFEAMEYVKIDYATISEWVYEADGEAYE